MINHNLWSKLLVGETFKNGEAVKSHFMVKILKINEKITIFSYLYEMNKFRI
jgi:hypothetical protein